MRFLLEIYAKIRTLVGDDFPILVKLTASEFFEGGLTFAETRLICKKLGLSWSVYRSLGDPAE